MLPSPEGADGDPWPSDAFDRITAMAARMFDVGVAAISVDSPGGSSVLSQHGNYAEQVLDGAPWAVAAPLVTRDGRTLGALILSDQRAREFTEPDARILADLASLVVDGMEVRSQAEHLVGVATRRLHDVESLAHALQSSLLPPVTPSIPGVDLAAKYHPASRLQVGGDFYDVFPIAHGCWAIVIGDVCGKGPAAAARTSAARYSIRTAAIEESSPSQVLRVVNEALLREADSANGGGEVPFVTALFASVEPRPDRLVINFASAGHPLPSMLRANGDVFSVGTPGTLLGVLPDLDVTDSTLEVRDGDIVVFITDGVLDSGAPKRMQDDGFEGLLAACCGMPAQVVVERVHRAVVAHQRDDVAIVAITPSRQR